MTYASDILALSPNTYWRLGETTGTTAVDEQGAHDGTFAQPGLDMGEVGGITGDSDTSFYFQAGAQRVTSTGWSLSSGVYTMVVLTRLHSTPFGVHACAVCASADSTQRMMLVARRQATNNRLSYYDNTNTWHETTVTMALDEWVHVALVVNGTNVKMYHLGVEVLNDTISLPADTYDQIDLAADRVGSYAYKGWLDEVAIWDTALSGTQIADLHDSWVNNGSPTDPRRHPPVMPPSASVVRSSRW